MVSRDETNLESTKTLERPKTRRTEQLTLSQIITQEQITNPQNGADKKDEAKIVNKQEQKIQEYKRQKAQETAKRNQQEHEAADQLATTGNKGTVSPKGKDLKHLKPKKLPYNEKQIRIAGGEVKTITDYPTMDDIKSDWGTVDEKELLAAMKQAKKPPKAERQAKDKHKCKKDKDLKKKSGHDVHKGK